MSNIDNILTFINEVNETNLVPCYVPSLNEVIDFKMISVGQQQKMLKVLSTKLSDSLAVLNSLNEILFENCSVAHNFTVLDRDFIFSQYKMFEANGSLDELTILHQKFLASTPCDTSEITIDEFGFKVYVGIPQTCYDTEVNNFAIKNFIKKEMSDVDTAAALYNTQVLKFFKGLVVQGVEYYDLSVEEKAKIVGILPTKIRNKIYSYAAKVAADHRNAFSVRS